MLHVSHQWRRFIDVSGYVSLLDEVEFEWEKCAVWWYVVFGEIQFGWIVCSSFVVIIVME